MNGAKQLLQTCSTNLLAGRPQLAPAHQAGSQHPPEQVDFSRRLWNVRRRLNGAGCQMGKEVGMGVGEQYGVVLGREEGK